MMSLTGAILAVWTKKAVVDGRCDGCLGCAAVSVIYWSSTSAGKGMRIASSMSIDGGLPSFMLSVLSSAVHPQKMRRRISVSMVEMNLVRKWV